MFQNLFLLAQTAAPSNTGNTGGAIFAGGAFLIFIIILLIASVFWIWMLIDCLMSNKPAVEKLIWVLVIFFLHLIGALLYFFIGRGARATV